MNDRTNSTSDVDSAITEFVQAIRLLIRRLRAAGAAQDLSLTEGSVLARLAKTGPTTIADMARAESVKPQSMGATVAALEQQGLVMRAPHPTDGRQVLIAPTPQGSTLGNSVRDARHAWLAHTIATLDPTQQRTLFAAGDIIKRLADTP